MEQELKLIISTIQYSLSNSNGVDWNEVMSKLNEAKEMVNSIRSISTSSESHVGYCEHLWEMTFDTSTYNLASIKG